MPAAAATLAALLLTVAAGVQAAPPVAEGDLAPRIELQLKRGGLRGSRVGILVADLQTGETIYERNADELLVPASLTKIVTSAAALQVLKPQYRFRTALLGAGRERGAVFQGDVYLKAWGDPALVDERVWSLVDALRRRGIRAVEGSLRVDDSFFDRERFGEGWGPLSRSWYNAPHGAVSVNFNTLPVRGRTIAIDTDPSRNAGRVFVEMMRREGIELRGAVEVGGAVPEGAVALASSESKPLGEIVADLNKVSNNFIAEQVLKTLGAEASGPPGTAEKGLKVVASYLRGLGVQPREYALYDGSGLSHLNRLSARTLVRVLSAVVRDFTVGPEFLSSLKVAGAEGKTRRFEDPLCKRRMRVKTGHLYGVAGLGGFAETVGGRRLVFAILANDYRRGRHAADRGIEDVCEAFLVLGAPEDALVARDVLAGPPIEAASEPPVLGPDGTDEDEAAEEGD